MTRTIFLLHKIPVCDYPMMYDVYYGNGNIINSWQAIGEFSPIWQGPPVHRNIIINRLESVNFEHHGDKIDIGYVTFGCEHLFTINFDKTGVTYDVNYFQPIELYSPHIWTNKEHTLLTGISDN